MSHKELQELQHALKTMKESVEPDLDWMKSDRVALLSHVEKTLPASPEGFSAVTKAIVGRLFPREMVQLIRGPVVAALSIIVFVAGGSIVSVSAADRTLPGDFLYPVKIVAEQTRLVLTTDKSDRLELKTKFVDRRVQEIKTVATSNVVDKQARVKVAAEGLKRDLDTVNHQLEEVRDTASEDSIGAAKLLDKKSSEIAKELKQVKEGLSDETQQSVSEAETAAVSTSVKAVGVLIQSKKDSGSDVGMTDDELVQSISDKMDDIGAGIAQTAEKLNLPATSEEANQTDMTEAQTTASTTTTDIATAPYTKTSIVTATESLNEARKLLENNELDEIPEKLLLAVKAARDAEQEAVQQTIDANAANASSEDLQQSTSTESIPTETDNSETQSTSTPETSPDPQT